jgi:Phenylpropionate dioxygenase and related ring-hydroxylating dioxygenases, large terminal subunit
MEKTLTNGEVGAKIRDWRPYYEAKLGFRSHWYAAGLSHELAEDGVLTVTLLGEDILIRRTEIGIFAVRDKCLHRGVRLSKKVECYTNSTITCWYHGWTYRMDTGMLCDILTDPGSKMIGTRGLKTYPVQEASGLIFVYIGDEEPHPLAVDLPPGFLESTRASYGIRREVGSNWRIGAENGFDTTHIFIHKDSPFITGMDAAVPLGFASDKETEFEVHDNKEGPIGIVDHMTEHYQPVFQTTIEGQPAVSLKAPTGKHRTIHTVGMWLPGILSVENHPDYDTIQYEFYVPLDADRHMYFQVLQQLDVEDEAKAAAFAGRCRHLFEPLALRGFNDDDIWAREETQRIYQDDWGWIDEQLMEQDRNLIVWRRLASRLGGTPQSIDHTRGHK